MQEGLFQKGPDVFVGLSRGCSGPEPGTAEHREESAFPTLPFSAGNKPGKGLRDRAGIILFFVKHFGIQLEARCCADASSLEDHYHYLPAVSVCL